MFEEFAVKDLDVKSAYHLLISGISPRPIALVGSVDKEENCNLAPFSFFNAFGAISKAKPIGVCAFNF